MKEITLEDMNWFGLQCINDLSLNIWREALWEFVL